MCKLGNENLRVVAHQKHIKDSFKILETEQKNLKTERISSKLKTIKVNYFEDKLSEA